MNGKLIAILSYIPVLGWFIAFVVYMTNNEKSSLAGFHIRQALGLQMTFWGGSSILGYFGLSLLLSLFALVCLAFWVLALLGALKEEEKPVVFIGAYFQEWFGNIIR
jgi:uncharacterized membrane protein